ncbi:MAG: EutN/CcmL family microcompartment protein [Clostridiales bacterium]|nr:EutN/CcmL family microcompartment protein [Lachnospiraceae bacterium]MCD8046471.1 EutN/CcmL family microcompartment protein [Clostridiales bacterium]MCD8323392.1 EutN/CcmL family microcompartment protein [Clostridiales bacterium]MCD8333492.1 EutN/CcmL family microcompartment protein [Clostridiales bacterium]
MYTGVVVGSVVATVKDPALEGVPLLVVRKIENGKEAGLIVAADQTRQAGPGDHIYMIGSKEAARIYRRGNIPVDVAIVGFIDTYNEEL